MSRSRDRKARRRVAGLPQQHTTDPRTLPASIVDPLSDPFARGSVVVDTSRGIMLEELHVSTVDDVDGAVRSFAMIVSGRINQTPEFARVLVLMPLDGMAAIVSELFALSERAGRFPELMALVRDRLQAMPKAPTTEGSTTP